MRIEYNMNPDSSDNERKQERLARRRERERQARSQETAENRERRLARRSLCDEEPSGHAVQSAVSVTLLMMIY